MSQEQEARGEAVKDAVFALCLERRESQVAASPVHGFILVLTQDQHDDLAAWLARGGPGAFEPFRVSQFMDPYTYRFMPVQIGHGPALLEAVAE